MIKIKTDWFSVETRHASSLQAIYIQYFMKFYITILTKKGGKK
jgi:hypothetical protein